MRKITNDMHHINGLNNKIIDFQINREKNDKIQQLIIGISRNFLKQVKIMYANTSVFNTFL